MPFTAPEMFRQTNTEMQEGEKVEDDNVNALYKWVKMHNRAVIK